MNLSDHVRSAIDKTYKEQSALSQEVLSIKGLSTRRIRHLINNICADPIRSYLEVGTWLGSTLISAKYNNDKLTAIGIDNYSEEFEGIKPVDIQALLLENVKRTLGDPGQVTILESDCFNVRFLNQLKQYSLNRFQVYLYDGAHDEQSQYNGIVMYNDLLAPEAIVMVDDWELTDKPKLGTQRAFKDLSYKVLNEWHLPKKDGFHEGFYLALVRK